jgi:hypothetical protein
MSPARPTSAERHAVLEQRMTHVENELVRMAAKVDEMHAVLMQAKGVRWAVIAVSGLVGFLTGVSHWFLSKT